MRFKSAPQKLNFVMENAISKSYTLDYSRIYFFIFCFYLFIYLYIDIILSWYCQKIVKNN